MFWITALMKILNKKYLEAYSELRQTSKMERFAKIVNRFYQLNIPGIRSILDVWQSSEYASDISVKFCSLEDLRPFPISTFNFFLIRFLQIFLHLKRSSFQ